MLNGFSKNWGIPHNLPVFKESAFNLFESGFSFAIEKSALQFPVFYIGYEIRAPGFSDFKIVRLLHGRPGTLSIYDD